MANSSAGQWVKFFNASGIPSPAAATYAHIFVENRIQTHMLMDLTIQILKDMDITLMGDIIAILKHAKTVNDQTAREKVLSSELPLPIAAVQANPILPPNTSSSPTTKIRLKPTSTVTSSSVRQSSTYPDVVLPLPKTPRRVLPEHEGKYKIKLPTGSTERSKEILAKKANLYSDREVKGKPPIFERLSRTATFTIEDSPDADNDDKDLRIRISRENSSTSIFSRLGGKLKPILKNSPKSSHSSITKAKARITMPVINPGKQKVMLVKKVPLKTDSDNDDYTNESSMSHESDVEMRGTNEKVVKFASTAEVREIFDRFAVKAGPAKGRAQLVAQLHSTRRTMDFKPSSPKTRISHTKFKPRHMMADELELRKELPVHKRLGNRGSEVELSRTVSSLSRRMSKVELSNKRKIPGKNSSKTSSSVFDRLG